MPDSDDLPLLATNDTVERAGRHPCCGGPAHSNPVTLVTPTGALHRPTLPHDPQATTRRAGATD